MEKKQTEDRGNLFLKVLAPSILILGIQMVLIYMGQFFLFVYKVYNYKSGSITQFMKDYVAESMSPELLVNVSLAYTVVALIVFGIWYLKSLVTVEQAKDNLKHLAKNPGGFVAGLLAFSIGMQLVSVFLSSVLGILVPDWLVQFEKITESMGLDGEITIPVVIFTVIFAPMCEELAFRGLTFGFARKMMPFWVANVVQALLFAGMHMNPIQASYTFILGMFLGWFMEKTNKLSLCMLIHIVFNGTAVFASSLMAKVGNGPVQFFFTAFFAMAAAYMGFILLNRSVEKVGEKKED